MRQRVKVAQALVHDPDVIVLDEPLTGLDPRQRLSHDRRCSSGWASDGRCVVVSSHVLDEVERFGSRVLVMVQGRLAAEGDFRAHPRPHGRPPHRLRIRTDRPRRGGHRRSSRPRRWSAWSSNADGIDDRGDHRRWRRFRHALAAVAQAGDAQLFEVTPLDDDLESVFRYLVGR